MLDDVLKMDFLVNDGSATQNWIFGYLESVDKNVVMSYVDGPQGKLNKAFLQFLPHFWYI